MSHVSAKFLPRLLTDDQKENRVEISQKLLANANCNENESWVYVNGVETKTQSSQCLGKGSPRTK